MDIAELKRLANFALMGKENDAAAWKDYFAASGPTSVLELIAEVERLRAELAGMAEYHEGYKEGALENVSEVAEQLRAARAELEALRKQAPVAYQHRDGMLSSRLPGGGVLGTEWTPLYAAPVQAAPIVPDGWRMVPEKPTPDIESAIRVNMDYASCTPAQVWHASLAAARGSCQVADESPDSSNEPVRAAWARFCHELHRSPDAPYPGMSEAFECHFSQSFTDRGWRREAQVWAAAWKAAKRHGADGKPAGAC